MKKQRSVIKTADLVLNDGRLGWLPRNPRDWTKEDLEDTKASLVRDPDFLEDRPIIVVPVGKKYLAFCGNLRLSGVKALGWKEVEVVVYLPSGEDYDQEERETIKRRTLLDNGEYGHNNYDILADEWDDMEFKELGIRIPGLDKDWQKAGLSTEGREGGEGYDEFVDKFKEKLTTDDCYTPPAVYDAVKDFVDQQIRPLKNLPVVRPFFPGGNYEDLKQYPKGCVVLDNPPFSLFSKILRFYCEHKISFFLFGPHLTLFSAHELEELCYLPVCAPVTYENGAVVSTGFITNMVPGLKIWIPAGLRHKIREIQKDDSPMDEYLIPSCVITSSRLGALAGVKGCELKITTEECAYVKNLDSMEQAGKGLYGGGYLITEEKADWIEKEKEKEKENRKRKKQ